MIEVRWSWDWVRGPAVASWSVGLILLLTVSATAQPKIARSPERSDARPPQGPYQPVPPSPSTTAQPVTPPRPPVETAGAAAVRDASGQPAPTRAQKPSVSAPTSLPETDFYAQRAKGLLSEDARIEAKDGSLQAAYPEHNVVVCEAGCTGRGRRIVQFAPRVATNELRAAMQPTSAGIADATAATPSSASPSAAAQGAGPAPGDQPIACIAGCYGTPRRYDAASPSAAVVAPEAAAMADAVARFAVPVGASRRSATGATGSEAMRWMTTSARADEAAQKPARTPLKSLAGKKSPGNGRRESPEQAGR